MSKLRIKKYFVDGTMVDLPFKSNRDLLDNYLSPDTRPPVKNFVIEYLDSKTNETFEISIPNLDKEIFIKIKKVNDQ
jgi:hypothetical protein